MADTSAGSNTLLENPEGFAIALLEATKSPVTVDNVQNVMAWEAREGGGFGNIAAYNPLNTTLDAGGASDVPGTPGVKAYSDAASGFAATVATLQGFPTVLAALKKGNLSTPEFADVVGSSKWGTPSVGWPTVQLTRSQAQYFIENTGYDFFKTPVGSAISSLLVGGGNTGAGNNPGNIPSDVLGSTANSVDEAAPFSDVASALAWLGTNWLRVVEFVVGVGMVFYSLHLFIGAGMAEA